MRSCKLFKWVIAILKEEHHLSFQSWNHAPPPPPPPHTHTHMHAISALTWQTAPPAVPFTDHAHPYTLPLGAKQTAPPAVPFKGRASTHPSIHKTCTFSLCIKQTTHIFHSLHQTQPQLSPNLLQSSSTAYG